VDERREPFLLAALVVVAALFLGIRLGSAPLERAEIYFVDAARAMVESGDYLVPRYRGEPFFDKPALTYWLMAGAFRLFGFHLAAARLVPVAAALVVLVATAWLGRLLFDRRTGLLGACVLATTLLFLSFGRVAMSDMLLAAWSTLAVALGVVALRRTERVSPLLMTALGAALGLGFLTKGPVALLLPGLGLIVFARRERRWVPRASALGWALAVAAFVLLGLGWFAALYARLGAAPLAYFFLRENLERFAGETYDADRSPFYYLGAYLAVGLPWSLVFPLAAVRAREGGRFLLLWMGLMAVPLSLSRGKIDYYLLPLAPAGALIVARYLAAGEWRRLDRVWLRAVAVVFAALVGALAWSFQALPGEWLAGDAARLALVGVVALIAASSVLFVVRPTPARLLATLGGGTAALFVLLVAAFLPAFRRAQPNARVVEDVARELAYRKEAAVAVCVDVARVQRDTLFFLRRPMEERCDLWSVAASRVPYLILATPNEARSLAALPTLREVGLYRALPATALTLRGLIDGPQPESFLLLANFATNEPMAEARRKKERRRALKDE
jgi:4-amino-4-deoxy-L-arabinose transferase-like glycosyltransferase